MTPEKARFLQRVPLFEGLEDEYLNMLADLLLERRFPKGEVIFFEGDRGDALYMIRSGTVKVYRVAEDGREKTLALFGDGEFFGEMALFDEEPRSAIAQTLGETTVYTMHRPEFLRILSANPPIALQIIRELSSRLRQTNAQVMDVVFRDVRARISRTLADLADRHGVLTEDGVRIDLKLTHQELANVVGTARETVSRMLAELQDAACITVDGRHLILLDQAKIEEYALGD